jgi:hypothetical protein
MNAQPGEVITLSPLPPEPGPAPVVPPDQPGTPAPIREPAVPNPFPLEAPPPVVQRIDV